VVSALSDITSFEGAFLSKARGVAAVSQVDGVSLPIRAGRRARVSMHASSSAGGGMQRREDLLDPLGRSGSGMCVDIDPEAAKHKGRPKGRPQAVRMDQVSAYGML
jgi:hypothetical protein